MSPEPATVTLPKLAKAVGILAFVMAFMVLIQGIAGRAIIFLVVPVPLFAGISIFRRKASGAYGYAILLFAQQALVGLSLFRAHDPAYIQTLIGASAVSLVIGVLFFFAGRAMTRSGAERGSLAPWFVFAALSTLPFIFFQAFVIPTGSMENTLLIGDVILVRRFPRPNFSRGDIVSLIYPINRKQTFLKRIVGVGGDRLHIVNKKLFRNGVELNEPYAIHITDYTDPFRDNFPSAPTSALYASALEMLTKNVVNGEVVIPAGKYFVMGDNRDNSLDSRYWGFVEDSDLIGIPVMIYDSTDKSTEEVTDSGTFHRNRTRWDRLFKLL